MEANETVLLSSLSSMPRVPTGINLKLHAEASCSPFIHEDEARAYLAGENKRFTLSPIKVS